MLVVVGVFWWIATQASTGAYVISLLSSLSTHPDETARALDLVAKLVPIPLVVVGLAWLFYIAAHPKGARSPRRHFNVLRERWRMRNWTSDGLNWRVLPDSHGVDRNQKARAILSITPVPGSELPQPLEIVVVCAGLISDISSRFYFDQSKLEGESSGAVEIDAPEGKSVKLKLFSPKLFPPARWDLILHSGGNAEVKVVDVRRAPQPLGLRRQ